MSVNGQETPDQLALEVKHPRFGISIINPTPCELLRGHRKVVCNGHGCSLELVTLVMVKVSNQPRRTGWDLEEIMTINLHGDAFCIWQCFLLVTFGAVQVDARVHFSGVPPNGWILWWGWPLLVDFEVPSTHTQVVRPGDRIQGWGNAQRIRETFPVQAVSWGPQLSPRNDRFMPHDPAGGAHKRWFQQMPAETNSTTGDTSSSQTAFAWKVAAFGFPCQVSSCYDSRRILMQALIRCVWVCAVRAHMHNIDSFGCIWMCIHLSLCIYIYIKNVWVYIYIRAHVCV